MTAVIEVVPRGICGWSWSSSWAQCRGTSHRWDAPWHKMSGRHHATVIYGATTRQTQSKHGKYIINLCKHGKCSKRMATHTNAWRKRLWHLATWGSQFDIASSIQILLVTSQRYRVGPRHPLFWWIMHVRVLHLSHSNHARWNWCLCQCSVGTASQFAAQGSASKLCQ